MWAGYSYPKRDKEYVVLPTSNIKKNSEWEFNWAHGEILC